MRAVVCPSLISATDLGPSCGVFSAKADEIGHLETQAFEPAIDCGGDNRRELHEGRLCVAGVVKRDGNTPVEAAVNAGDCGTLPAQALLSRGEGTHSVRNPSQAGIASGPQSSPFCSIQFFTDLELVAVLAIVAVLSFVIGAGMRFVFMALIVGQ